MGEIRITIGENIKKICALKGIRQIEISDHLGVSQGSVSNWIKGTNSIDIENLAKLCRFLGVSLDQIYGFEPIKPDVSLSSEETNLMNFLEKVNLLMRENGLNRHTLSEACGIPYTTIDGWFKKGYEGAKVSTIIKLADFFSVELDYLVRPSITDRNFGRVIENVGSEEKELLTLYRSMNDTGKSLLMNTARTYAGNPDMQKEEHGASAM